MMTLKEAIKHCKDVALSCTNKECALEHFQLLKWLQEYSNMLEKQGEQKITDKVESKFKVGDWAVTNYGKVSQIVSVDKDGDGYTLDDGVYFSGSWCDIYHLWTIQDAKDGDVLADNVGVILFKSIRDNNVINYYAYLSRLFAVQEGEKYWGSAVNCTLSPATKEQRERFFAAMHDAGYEWNAEKKELKKIEQKPTDKEMKELLRTEYEKGRADVIAEMQKPWSEEDELKRNTLIDVVKKQRGSAIFEGLLPEELTDWLESLRPQNRWKPTKEQLYWLKQVIPNNSTSVSNEMEVLSELYRQLKALKEL